MGAACRKMIRKKNKSLSDEALQIFRFTKISDSVESCLLQGVFDWEAAAAAQRAESRVRQTKTGEDREVEKDGSVGKSGMIVLGFFE